MVKEAAEKAEKKGKKLGLKEGEEKGIQKGKKLGFKEGEKQKAIEIAKALLKKGLDTAFIVDATGLTAEEVEKVRGR